VPFSERSAGFIWFFSFLVKFAQVQKNGGKLILLLDEPGLTLHGKAQADLLRYFVEKLAPEHQVIFTTHSPFIVPADNLPGVRIVEDRILQQRPGQWVSEGTRELPPQTLVVLLGGGCLPSRRACRGECLRCLTAKRVSSSGRKTVLRRGFTFRFTSASNKYSLYITDPSRGDWTGLAHVQ
jgi:AAA ATPase-like protein